MKNKLWKFDTYECALVMLLGCFHGKKSLNAQWANGDEQMFKMVEHILNEPASLADSKDIPGAC